MKSTPEKHFYTLIEIMTVIVIAAILFGIGIPAFTTMIQGNNMTVAIRQLSAKITAARAYAVANRCNVAVLLMETNVKDDYCYSAYRVCVVDNDNKFQEWIEDENWKTLPKGVLRESVSTKETITDIATYSDEFIALFKQQLDDIYNADMAFVPTDDQHRCETCPYASLCRG